MLLKGLAPEKNCRIIKSDQNKEAAYKILEDASVISTCQNSTLKCGDFIKNLTCHVYLLLHSECSYQGDHPLEFQYIQTVANSTSHIGKFQSHFQPLEIHQSEASLESHENMKAELKSLLNNNVTSSEDPTNPFIWVALTFIGSLLFVILGGIAVTKCRSSSVDISRQQWTL